MAEDLTPTPAPPGSPLSGILERLLDEAEAGAPINTTPPTPPPPQSPPTDRPPTDRPSFDRPPSDRPPADPAPFPPPPVGAPAGVSAGAPAGNPLGPLLQNPALLSALPALLENLSPLLGSLGNGVGSSPHATRPHFMDRHTALLCALKPYLSPHRRETAETVIRLCRVWDALERSGVSLTGLLGSAGNAAPRAERRDDGVQ